MRAAVAFTVVALAAVGCGHDHGATAAPDPAAPRAQTFGHEALPAQATRTVEVRLLDSLRFEPATIPVKPGEVVTFRLVNAGRTAHEFTIGGPAAQELHEAQMAEMDMSGEGDGMAMDMKMHDPTHAKYLKALAKRVAELDRQAAANDSVHVLPGETKELTWAFTGAQLPAFACHVPGHWKSGMTGTFPVG
ncbi:MAG TPA: copper-binding protein [Acidimicrobiia bacterium]|nr:copper-binding protein [Acidimicrobiia bacterium]